MNKKINNNFDEIMDTGLISLKFEGLGVLKEALKQNKITVTKSRKLMVLINNFNSHWEAITIIKALQIIFGFDKEEE